MIITRTFNFSNPLRAQEKFMPLVPLASYKDSLPHSTFSTLEFSPLLLGGAVQPKKPLSET